MATLIDLLRHLGENQGPSGENAFRGPLHVSADPVAPVSVPLPPALVASWCKTTGRRTAAHHALALAASRTPSPVVLQGPAAAPDDDLLLLVFAHLAQKRAATALWLVGDKAAGAHDAAYVEEIAPSAHVSWASTVDGATPRVPVQLVIARFDDLHARLLRFSDRAWRWLWPRLDLIAVPAADRALHDWGSHMAWLLRRSERLTGAPVRLGAALSGAIDPDSVLEDIFGPSVRIVPVPSGLADPALVAVWHGGEPGETLGRLASQLHQRGVSVTVLGQTEDETAALRSLETQVPHLRVGQPPTAARVALVAGLPVNPVNRAAWIRRGYRMLLFVVEDNPHELLFSAEVERLLARVPVPANHRNPYVVGRHLQCAAGELPLSSTEIEQWGVGDQIERMVARRLLRPAGAGQWRPGESAAECDADLTAMVLGEQPVDVFDDHGRHVSRIRPAVADRMGIPGATWWPGSVVANRAGVPPRIDLAREEQIRVALPLLSIRLEVIEAQATRDAMVGAQAVPITRAKVRIHQRVLGLREHRPGRDAATLRMRDTREQTWVARGLSINLAATPSDPATAGWSLAATLPPQLNVGPDALLATYDTPTRAIWVLETEPGGTGIADYCFEHAEQLLTSALAFVHVAGASPRFSRLAADERSWLGTFLAAAEAPEREAQHDHTSRAQPPAELPPVTAVEPRLQPLVEPVSERVTSRTGPQAPATDGRRTRVYALPAPARPVPPPPPQAADPLPIENAAQHDLATEPAPPRVAASRTGEHVHPRDVAQLPILPPYEPAEHEHVPSDGEAQRAELARAEVEQGEPQDITVDVTWGTGSLAELSDEVAWAAGSDELGVEEVSWEPETNPAAGETLPHPTSEQEIPPLGRESPVPLSSRQPPSRYRSERGEPTQRPIPAQAVPSRRPMPSAERNQRDRQKRSPNASVPSRGSPTPPSPSRAEPVQRSETTEDQRGDVGAMIARMRRLREEREREKGSTSPPAGIQSEGSEQPEARFRPGQQVRCVPYGSGIVRKAQVVAGREQLTIEFADGGTALVDPAINAVRVIEDEPRTSAEDDF